jgi:hypothetical protein
VEDLLSGYAASSAISLESMDREFIWGLGGGYPFFVQMAGHYLLEGRERGMKGDPLLKFATENFDMQADSHYAYLWSHCTESEKITLITIQALGLQKSSKKTVPSLENLARLRARAPQDLAALAKRGLVVERDASYSLFSASLGRWIKQEILAVPGEEESQASAEEWVRSGGHKELKPSAASMTKFKRKYWGLLGDLAKELSLEVAATGAMELIKLMM